MQAFVRICNGRPLRFLGTDVAFSWHFLPIYNLGLALTHPFIDFSRLDIGYSCHSLAFRYDFVIFRHVCGSALAATFVFLGIYCFFATFLARLWPWTHSVGLTR